MASYHINHVRLNAQEQIGSHVQPTWELDYVIRGHGVKTLGNRQMPFAEGEVVLVRPELPHGWAFDTANEEIENITVTFTDDFLRTLAATLPEMAAMVEACLSLPAAVSLTGKRRERVTTLLVDMLRQTEAEGLMTLLHILHLISQAEDLQAIGRFETITHAEHRLKAIDTYLICNYARSISLDDIARHVGMNRSSLCSFYKRQTGSTLIERLTAMRIEQARFLLSRPDSTVTSVCYAVGFNDLPHFCRIFKRETGVSPREFRTRRG